MYEIVRIVLYMHFHGSVNRSVNYRRCTFSLIRYNNFTNSTKSFVYTLNLYSLFTHTHICIYFSHKFLLRKFLERIKFARVYS